MSRAGDLDLERLLRYGVALCVAGAGLVHLSAARDHPVHPHLAAFFVVLALAQIAYAAALAFRPRPGLLGWGLGGNLAVVALWAVTRVTAIPFVPGLSQAEPVALKNAVATLFEILAVTGAALLLVAPEAARRAAIPSPDRVVGALIAAAMVLTVPGVLGSHGHGAGHGVHGDGVEAASHGSHGGLHGDDGAEATVHDAGTHAGTLAAQHTEHVALSPNVVLAGASHAAHSVGASHAAPLPGAAANPAHDGHGGDGGRGPRRDSSHENHGSASGPPATSAAPGELVTIKYGPFSLPPASTNRARHSNVLLSNTVLTQLPPPCRDCFITGMWFDLVYEDGSSVNYDTGAMLHHHVMFDSADEDRTCTRFAFGVGIAGKRIFAAGNERTSGAFPPGFGLFIERDSWWSGIWELMNFTDQPKTVWFKLDVRTLPASAGLKKLEPIWLDQDNCSDSQFAVPAGRTVKTWDWTSDITGRIVWAGGHVHDGGVSITLSNESQGTRVCKSVAGYGNKPAYRGHIDTMTTCSWDRIGTVRKGETLRITTIYDTPTAADDVMGIMMAFVYETNDLAGGTPAPRRVTNPPDSTRPPTPAGHDH